jgi:hypothetical protein
MEARQVHVLTGLHSGFLLDTGVIMSQHVKHTVHHQQGQLIGDSSVGGRGVANGNGRTDHHVAQQDRLCRSLVVAGGSRLGRRFIDGPRQDVSGSFRTHPLGVELGHLRLADKAERELG